MRRIDYSEPIMPKDAPTAERSESTGEIMGRDRQPTSAYYLNIFDGTGSTGSTKAEGRSKGEANEQAPKKSADEIMAEANAEAAAMD